MMYYGGLGAIRINFKSLVKAIFVSLYFKESYAQPLALVQ